MRSSFVFSINKAKGLGLINNLISSANSGNETLLEMMELGLDDDDQTYFTEKDDIATIPLERIIEARVHSVSFRVLEKSYVKDGVIYIYASLYGSILEERGEEFFKFVYDERMQAFVWMDEDRPEEFYEGEAPRGINCNSQAIVLDFSVLTVE